MIEKTMYLSDEHNLNPAMEVTGLSQDEIETVVGRFRANSSRAGQLRGEVYIYSDGKVEIRHHFTKQLIWSNQEGL